MEQWERRKIGRTGLEVTSFGLGTASLGFKVAEDEPAREVTRRALALGVTFVDTAPFYGHGLAERRIGPVLQAADRTELVISTKVGYVIDDNPPPFGTPIPRDYSYDGTLRCVEGSLQRMGIDRVDILLIHDCDDHYEQALTGAYPALERLRAEGTVKAIGAGLNQAEMLASFARETDMDCFLLAGRYTLLDQGALPELLPLCVERGISIFIGGPLNSSILADPWSPNARFNYQPAEEPWLSKARALEAVCKRHGVPLPAAALQFPLAHPAVVSVLTGAHSLEQLEENAQLMRHPIPPALWQELKAEGLLPAEAPAPGGTDF